jgi:cell division protein FtsB
VTVMLAGNSLVLFGVASMGGTDVESIGALAGLLAPIAFVFAISAYTQVNALKKEIERLNTEVKNLKTEIHNHPIV